MNNSYEHDEILAYKDIYNIKTISFKDKYINSLINQLSGCSELDLNNKLSCNPAKSICRLECSAALSKMKTAKLMSTNQMKRCTKCAVGCSSHHLHHPLGGGSGTGTGTAPSRTHTRSENAELPAGGINRGRGNGCCNFVANANIRLFAQFSSFSSSLMLITRDNLISNQNSKSQISDSPNEKCEMRDDKWKMMEEWEKERGMKMQSSFDRDLRINEDIRPKPGTS